MTIGILSWGSHKTLEQTLQSYKQYNFGIYDDDRIIYFQQISEEDIRLAKKYGWNYLGGPTNVGIAEGYKTLVNAAKGDTFIFLENDWKLIENPSAAMTDARFLLSSKDADLVRLRHRHNPGNPLWTRQFEGHEMDRPTHLLDSVHWLGHPAAKYPEYIGSTTMYKRVWYIATSQHANWTNNPHLSYTRFLKENVLPHIGSGNIEGTLQGWWEKQNFRVAQGEGLFTHDRID